MRHYEPGGGDYAESRGGVRWEAAPLPPRLHWCRPWTRAVLSGEWLEMCACGAHRGDFPVDLWRERNRRRRRETGQRETVNPGVSPSSPLARPAAQDVAGAGS